MFNMYTRFTDSKPADGDCNLHQVDHRSNNHLFFRGGKQAYKHLLSWRMFKGQTSLFVNIILLVIVITCIGYIGAFCSVSRY